MQMDGLEVSLAAHDELPSSRHVIFEGSEAC
jgi:hypothetical protein